MCCSCCWWGYANILSLVDNVCCRNEHVFRSIFPLKRLHMKSRRLNGMRHMFNDNVWLHLYRHLVVNPQFDDIPTKKKVLSVKVIIPFVYLQRAERDHTTTTIATTKSFPTTFWSYAHYQHSGSEHFADISLHICCHVVVQSHYFSLSKKKYWQLIEKCHSKCITIWTPFKIVRFIYAVFFFYLALLDISHISK